MNKTTRIVPSDLMRRKRNTHARIRTLSIRLGQEMRYLQDIANELSIVYQDSGMPAAQREANLIVNALRTHEVFNEDRLSMSSILHRFNVLPED